MTLRIIGLKKSFGEKNIFKHFSYDFPSTGIFAITGDSGIGKTTLLRIIAGLDKDYEGYLIGGGKQNVSFAFQEYRLFPELTAVENVFFANSESKTEAEAKEMLTLLGFNDSDMLLFPDELSGGMKQRVSLARAFLKDTPILLLDEPTKELDSKNVDAVYEIIKECAKTRLIILVSHNEDDAFYLMAKTINLNNK